MKIERPNELMKFYDSIKDAYAPFFKSSIGILGHYSVHFPNTNRHEIPNGQINIELLLPKKLDENAICFTNIFYNFPRPCNEPNKLIRGLQKIEEMVSELRKRGYQDIFTFCMTLHPGVVYSLRKNTSTKEEVIKVFQNLNSLEKTIIENYQL